MRPSGQHFDSEHIWIESVHISQVLCPPSAELRRSHSRPLDLHNLPLHRVSAGRRILAAKSEDERTERCGDRRTKGSALRFGRQGLREGIKWRDGGLAGELRWTWERRVPSWPVGSWWQEFLLLWPITRHLLTPDGTIASGTPRRPQPLCLGPAFTTTHPMDHF